MTHIKGHVPNQTLEIMDVTTGETITAHGFLHPYKEDETNVDKQFRIIFINNLDCDICKSTVKQNGLTDAQLNERRHVGFHLKLIDTNNPGQKMALAYDIINWDEHQAVEKYVKAKYKNTSLKVEHLTDDQFNEAIDEAIAKDLKIPKDKIRMVLSTSQKYTTSKSFKILYNQQFKHPYKVIKSAVKTFTPFEFLGGYK